MVHKKYIKIKGKTYGPYYYESYRQNGKIKKRYFKDLRRVNKNASKNIPAPFIFLYFSITAILVILLSVSYLIPSFSFKEFFLGPDLLLSPGLPSFVSDGNVNMTIFDDTDLGENRFSGINTGFYVNYTDVSGNMIDDSNGLCQIRYDSTGSYTNFVNMAYNSLNQRWEDAGAFNHKGIHLFDVACTSPLGNLNTNNEFVISNSEPEIFETPGGFVNIDGNKFNTDFLNCVEDSLCVYNFSANVSDVDVNDVLSYGNIPGPNSTLTNFVINALTGILEIDITNNADTGQKKVELTVTDSGDGGGSPARATSILNVNIGAINDPPIFKGLENKSFNSTQLFDYIINVSDEEGNIPFNYNISFVSCNTAQWSDRGSVNCDLFNKTQYTTDNEKINISFTPSRNDAGTYMINFSVSDFNNNLLPYNATTSVIVNFSVLNINADPYFRYVCDNERVAVEDVKFNCHINVSDIDEVNNLTLSSDPSWFVKNSTNVNITTEFNGSIPVNFIPRDENVGNWLININMTDTGSPIRYNSTAINFLVENVNDSVFLGNINNVIAYTTETNKRIYVNATDNDLLIPDKTLYNEILTFSSNYSCVQISPQEIVSGTNLTIALIEFNPSNGGCFSAGSNYTVNISVSDANGFSIDSRIFVISAVGNDLLQWNDPGTEHVLIEGIPFYLNLSENVSDPNNDAIIFSSDESAFPSFSIGADTGVIGFTPIDEDVGQHIFYINATDIATTVPLLFNFTVRNVNDNPNITTPFQGNNISLNGININVQEDADVEIFVFATDDDLRVPNSQAGIYQESFTADLVIEGANSNLFNFVDFSYFNPNLIRYRTVFTPRKQDIGAYNVTINITDSGNISSVVWFNLSIAEVQHAPVLMELSDQGTIANRTLYYDINASDIEDGDDGSGLLTYSYAFLSDGGNDFINGNERVFNSSSGILNVTFSDAQVGKYHLNITVRDSFGLKDNDDFWIFVYDLPKILTPGIGFVFKLAEGNQSNLIFSANSSGAGNLSYHFLIGGNLRHSMNYYGDGTTLVWKAVPAFTDETYGLFGNLSLIVAIPNFEYLNKSMTWNANISHSNAPVVFFNSVGDKQGNFGDDIIINLRSHFFDADNLDYNQSFDFKISSNANGNSSSSAILAIVNNWNLSLSAGVATSEILNVTISDLNNSGKILTSAVSNNFWIRFTDPKIIQQPQSGGGGGGGGGGGSSREKPVSLRIIVPDPVSTKKGELLILPIQIVNEGPVTLEKIDLRALLFKDGILSENLEAKLDKELIESLPAGKRENLTLTIQLTNEPGIYEININADVATPDYSDSAKIYINVEEGQTIEEKLLFTEEFIVENPECIELKELVDESRDYFKDGDFRNAEEKLDEAVNACKDSISQRSLFSKDRLKARFEDNVFVWLLIATVIAVILGVGYYAYTRIMLKKALEAVEKMEVDRSNFIKD